MTIPDSSIWIESPTGKTCKALPFYQAVRILRKQRGWSMASVVPASVLLHFSRSEYFLMLWYGSRDIVDIKIAYNKKWSTGNKLLSVKGLTSIVIGIVAYVVINNLIKELDNGSVDMGNYKYYPFCKLRYQSLWITSPSGNTVISVPYYNALRYIRNRKWTLTKTEPMHYPSRWDIFKMLLNIRRNND